MDRFIRDKLAILGPVFGHAAITLQERPSARAISLLPGLPPSFWDNITLNAALVGLKLAAWVKGAEMISNYVGIGGSSYGYRSG